MGRPQTRAAERTKAYTLEVHNFAYIVDKYHDRDIGGAKFELENKQDSILRRTACDGFQSNLTLLVPSSSSAVLMGIPESDLQYCAAFRLEIFHIYTKFLESRSCGGDSYCSNGP